MPTPTAFFTDLWAATSYPIVPAYLQYINSWLVYLISAVYEAFSGPCRFSPNEATFPFLAQRLKCRMYLSSDRAGFSVFQSLTVTPLSPSPSPHKMYSTISLLASTLLLSATAHAAIREHWWNITYTDANPDGVSHSFIS